jgi:hypothetical protein
VKLWARRAAALEALLSDGGGDEATLRAALRGARAAPRQLGLPSVDASAAAVAAASTNTARVRRAVLDVIKALFNTQHTTQAALRSHVLSVFSSPADDDATAASGVHIDARDDSGFNLLWAIANFLVDGGRGSPAITSWLLAQALQRGADPNQRFADGRTPLMYVAHAGSTPVALDAARALLAAGARVNARDGTGYTPLLCALSTDDRAPTWRAAPMVRTLLSAGW